jgi:hypothetical protein
MMMVSAVFDTNFSEPISKHIPIVLIILVTKYACYRRIKQNKTELAKTSFTQMHTSF